MAAIKNSAISQGFVDPGSSTNTIGRYEAAGYLIGRYQGYGQNFNIHLSSTKAKFSDFCRMKTINMKNTYNVKSYLKILSENHFIETSGWIKQIASTKFILLFWT